MNCIAYVQVWSVKASNHERGHEDLELKVRGTYVEALTMKVRLKDAGYNKVEYVYAGTELLEG